MTTIRILRADVPDREEPFLPAVAPEWSKDFSAWLARQDASWRTAGVVLALFVLVFGFFMLAGDWYASMQGLRIPLALVGLPVSVTGIPAWPWWILPIGSTVIQIVCRKLRWLRWLWWPSIWYDGLTNATALGLGGVLLAQRLGVPLTVELVAALGAIGSLLGLALAIAAEKAIVAAVLILVSLRR